MPEPIRAANVRPTGLPTCGCPPGASVNGSRRGTWCFVFAGRVEPEKGLVEFLLQLPNDFDAMLNVIGDGSDLQRCRAICEARNCQNRVQFLGRLSHPETLVEIGRAHVLVQPSRVLETYGLTLIEALAMGTNLLVSNRGAAREIVDDASIGYLYDVNDSACLAERLNEIRSGHSAGTLNRFDASAFLAARDESAYVTSLVGIYGANREAQKRAA